MLGTDKVMTLDGTGCVDIPVVADMDDAKYRLPGQFRFKASSAETLNHAPFNTPFALKVEEQFSNGYYPMQIAREYATGAIKVRTWSYFSSKWMSGWRETAQIESGTFEFNLVSLGDERKAIIKSQNGHYTQIGNMLFVRLGFELSGKGTLLDTDNLYIRGIPKGYGKGYASASIGWWQGANLPNGLCLELSSNSINMYKPTASGVTNVKAADIENNFKVEDISGWKML